MFDPTITTSTPELKDLFQQVRDIYLQAERCNNHHKDENAWVEVVRSALRISNMGRPEDMIEINSVYAILPTSNSRRELTKFAGRRRPSIPTFSQSSQTLFSRWPKKPISHWHSIHTMRKSRPYGERSNDVTRAFVSARCPTHTRAYWYCPVAWRLKRREGT